MNSNSADLPNMPVWVIASLAIAETLVWAGYYYSFPAMLLFWESDLGWSRTELTFAFTASLIVSAILAPVSGRLIDRGRGPISLCWQRTPGQYLAIRISICRGLLAISGNLAWHWDCYGRFSV